MIRILNRIGVAILLLLLVTGTVFATSVDENNATIQQLRDKIASLQTEQNSLSKQITLLDSQIRLTQLEMDDTKRRVEQLDKERG